MNKLNLPIISQLPDFKPKTLTMDEYLKFVNFNLKYTADMKASRRQKKMFFVNVPFKIGGNQCLEKQLCF